jgi:hypothetical protein
LTGLIVARGLFARQRLVRPSAPDVTPAAQSNILTPQHRREQTDAI